LNNIETAKNDKLDIKTLKGYLKHCDDDPNSLCDCNEKLMNAIKIEN